MKRNDKYVYLVLDGMPYIIDDRKQNWVFADTTHAWTKQGGDNWDAVYPNRNGWWKDLFQDKPELPRK
jgi:hypothetical protein